MRNTNKISKQLLAERVKAENEMTALRDQLAGAYRRFDDMSDSSAMDACIYEISALRAKYNYAVKNAKTLFF